MSLATLSLCLPTIRSPMQEQQKSLIQKTSACGAEQQLIRTSITGHTKEPSCTEAKAQDTRVRFPKCGLGSPSCLKQLPMVTREKKKKLNRLVWSTGPLGITPFHQMSPYPEGSFPRHPSGGAFLLFGSQTKCCLLNLVSLTMPSKVARQSRPIPLPHCIFFKGYVTIQNQLFIALLIVGLLSLQCCLTAWFLAVLFTVLSPVFTTVWHTVGTEQMNSLGLSFQPHHNPFLNYSLSFEGVEVHGGLQTCFANGSP